MLTITNKEEIVGNKYSFFPPNMENDAAIIGSIYPAEKKFLQPLLGVELYNDMVAEGSGVVSNYTNAAFIGGAPPPVQKFPNNAAYETLWANMLLQFCSIAIMHESLPFIAAQIQTNGIVQQNPQGATGLTIKDAQTLQLQHRDTINDLWYNIEEYLCKNAEDFPLFKKDKCRHYKCIDLCDPTNNKQISRIKKGVVFYGLERKNKRY